MRIKVKREPDNRPVFSTLASGEVFRSNNSLYMRVCGAAGVVNAVRLNDGTGASFDLQTKVDPVNGIFIEE
jgi:hypothetical protein